MYHCCAYPAVLYHRCSRQGLMRGLTNCIRCVHSCTAFKRFDAVNVLMEGYFNLNLRIMRELCNVGRISYIFPVLIRANRVVYLGLIINELENVHGANHW